MKKQMSEYKLSDEFKSNLKLKLDKEYEEVNKSKITNKLNFFPRQLVAAMACLVIVFSTCAFADNIGNCINKYLCNTDKDLQAAIEEGNVQNVDMEYIETEDLSIRVSQLVVEENNLYIVFDVLTKEEWDRIYIDELEIHDENGNVIFDSEKPLIGVNDESVFKRISKNNFLIIYQFDDIRNSKDISVIVEKIKLKKQQILMKEVDIKIDLIVK